MDLAEFNAASADEVQAQLRPCLNVARWVQEVDRGRPYASVEDCVAAARTAAHPLAPEEVDAALADHPRIGERDSSDSAEAEFSRKEQASLGSAEDTVQQRLAAGNAAYEEKFGRVFLIRAAGRTHEEILAELDRRLTLHPDDELQEVGDQLEQIAALRLEGLLR